MAGPYEAQHRFLLNATVFVWDQLVFYPQNGQLIGQKNPELSLTLTAQGLQPWSLDLAESGGAECKNRHGVYCSFLIGAVVNLCTVHSLIHTPKIIQVRQFRCGAT